MEKFTVKLKSPSHVQLVVISEWYPPSDDPAEPLVSFKVLDLTHRTSFVSRLPHDYSCCNQQIAKTELTDKLKAAFSKPTSTTYVSLIEDVDKVGSLLQVNVPLSRNIGQLTLGEFHLEQLFVSDPVTDFLDATLQVIAFKDVTHYAGPNSCLGEQARRDAKTSLVSRPSYFRSQDPTRGN